MLGRAVQWFRVGDPAKDDEGRRGAVRLVRLFQTVREFPILWEVGQEPPYATVHLMPPTGEQIAEAHWIEECWKMLNWQQSVPIEQALALRK